MPPRCIPFESKTTTCPLDDVICHSLVKIEWAAILSDNRSLPKAHFLRKTAGKLANCFLDFISVEDSSDESLTSWALFPSS